MMTDKNHVQVGEGSPEYVAYKLLRDIATIEGGLKDRKAILDTYAECLRATSGYRN
jgi:hypothetical protein